MLFLIRSSIIKNCIQLKCAELLYCNTYMWIFTAANSKHGSKSLFEKQ
jgi:hypothetical protein